MRTLDQIFQALSYSTHIRIDTVVYRIIHTILEKYLQSDGMDFDLILRDEHGREFKMNLDDQTNFKLIANADFMKLINIEELHYAN